MFTLRREPSFLLVIASTAFAAHSFGYGLHSACGSISSKDSLWNDERLKEIGGGNYFDELLARIRDIRSSEKVFWRKVLDIYATSIDYDSKTDISREFFAVVQNKMHWAAHGHTAAEIVASRADASKPNMGLTSWIGGKPSRTDVEVAKNYLSHEELDILNRIVTMHLENARVAGT